MATEDEAKRAIDALHGTVLDNRTLTVNEAREREPMAPRGGGDRPRGGGGGGRDFKRGGGRGGRGGRGGGRDRGDW
jgi:RNA recognition motif-containing protein